MDFFRGRVTRVQGGGRGWVTLARGCGRSGVTLVRGCGRSRVTLVRGCGRGRGAWQGKRLGQANKKPHQVVRWS